MEGIERLKILSSEIKDESLLQVVDYLLSREDMNEKYLNEEKSLKQMIEFINNEVLKRIPTNERKDVQCKMLTNEDVYSMAIHYFDESNEFLGLASTKVKTNIEQNVQADEATGETKNDIEVVEEESVESSNVSENPIVEIKTNRKIKEKYVPEGQLSLFDIVG